MATEYKKRIVSVLVENAPNVMTRVSSVLGRRGFNIDTITVSTTNNPNITRITIVFNVEEHYIPQIMKQLEKVEVVK
jgi:acetolactate synthase-1/3 small subunit